MANILLVVLLGLVVDDEAIEVEPADLATKQALVGKEIIVDDRVKLFYPHPGRGIDEIHLQRTPIIFRLPPSLRYMQAPSERSIRVKGILRKSGDTLVCDVTEAPVLYRTDLLRLDADVARLRRDDLSGRVHLAEWASQRGTAFHDDSLLTRAESLASEAFALERSRAESSAEALLILARRARERKIPEPAPSEMAHRAFAIKLAQSKTKADFDRLATEIVLFFPKARNPAGEVPGAILADYKRDPADAYRRAGQEAQAALDRRLWTDAVIGSFRLSPQNTSREKMVLAEDAKRMIPDRPEITSEFRVQGFDLLAKDPTKLREEEIETLVEFYRVEKKDPETATRKIRQWLDDQKEHLVPSDADGRIKLAKQYNRWLTDKTQAAELLYQAEEIDPKDATIRGSVQEIFQRMGFQRIRGKWELGNSAANGAGGRTGSNEKEEDPYVGLTQGEIRAQLGKPERVCRVASQGRISIQWVYRSSKGLQYIDFLQRLGDTQATVVGRYTSQ